MNDSPNFDMFAKLDDNGNIVRPPHSVRLPDGSTAFNVHRNPEWLAANGFEEHSEEWFREHAYVRQRCTKYQLVTCLTAYYPALLETLRAKYAESDDLQFYWNTVNDLDRNNDDFKTAQAALEITDAQVKEIFSKIEGDEPAAVEE